MTSVDQLYGSCLSLMKKSILRLVLCYLVPFFRCILDLGYFLRA
jgi:hypothetical protein